MSKRHYSEVQKSRRAASTKTRIETEVQFPPSFDMQRVAGRHPLKQGLKQWKKWWTMGCLNGRRAASTKTRIETNDWRIHPYKEKLVAGRHPLKQGLKHSIDNMCNTLSKSQGGIH